MICPECNSDLGDRENVYGTICVKCNSYIHPLVKPKFIIEAEEKLQVNQEIIRNFLKSKILGEYNGNKTQ